MVRFVNHYEVLGVERDADDDSIKKAYRRLAAMYHPDRACQLSRREQVLAGERMRKVNAAKTVLLDVRERADFDRLMLLMEMRGVPTSTEAEGDVEVTIITEEFEEEEDEGTAQSDIVDIEVMEVPVPVEKPAGDEAKGRQGKVEWEDDECGDGSKGARTCEPEDGDGKGGGEIEPVAVVEEMTDAAVVEELQDDDETSADGPGPPMPGEAIKKRVRIRITRRPAGSKG